MNEETGVSHSSVEIKLRSFLEESVRHTPALAFIEQFILKYGEIFRAGAHPLEVRRGPAKECFSNAAELASFDHTYSYTEGFASSTDMLPFLHAWCVKDGLAVDPTLNKTLSYVYFGVVIPRQTLFDTLETQGHYGVLSGSMAASFVERWVASH